MSGTSVSGAFSRAFQRALSITSLRSSLVISPQSMRTSVTPGCTATRVSTSFLICARSGQPPMVSLTPTVTTPSSATTRHVGHHAEGDDVGAELGVDDRRGAARMHLRRQRSAELAITKSMLRVIRAVTLHCRCRSPPVAEFSEEDPP